MKRDAELDVQRIQVEAERVAWEAPGVTQVENHIAIAAQRMTVTQIVVAALNETIKLGPSAVATFRLHCF